MGDYDLECFFLFFEVESDELFDFENLCYELVMEMGILGLYFF